MGLDKRHDIRLNDTLANDTALRMLQLLPCRILNILNWIAKCHNVKYHNAESPECHYAECLKAKDHHGECVCHSIKDHYARVSLCWVSFCSLHFVDFILSCVILQGANIQSVMHIFIWLSGILVSVIMPSVIIWVLSCWVPIYWVPLRWVSSYWAS